MSGRVEGNFVSICLNVLLLLLLFLKMKIARGHSNSGKSKKTFPPCEGREVVPKKNHRTYSRLPFLWLAWLFSWEA